MGVKREGEEWSMRTYSGISNLVNSLDFIALVAESSPLLRPDVCDT